ncbi:MAVICYANIN-LIKE [Salix koriyanagi]|uniref:MAVICYANIN-LIKE n=1 Tax=Salix koriyanagi TaxID=2511006 RepID=A0A9Q0SSK4_9ROSI|nr:MAVICYANIN-LIKE [Salix koriyanagi]
MALCGVSMAAVYQAGDSAGWTSMGQVDYKEWAANKNFSRRRYSLATYTNGSDTVTLEKHGHFYFICGYPGHCQAGQKIDISVVPATSNLSPARPPTQSSLSSASSLSLSVPSILLSWAFGVLLAFFLSGFPY